MHDALFAAAMKPPRFVVLGLPLLNYTIGHELLLWQAGNAIVTGDWEKAEGSRLNAKVDQLSNIKRMEALIWAVRVCCVRKPFFYRRWLQECFQKDVQAEWDRFQAYRGAGSLDLPTVRMPRVQGQPYHYFGGPEVARLINYVTSRHKEMIAQHFEGSPLNFPLGLARMLCLVELECEGAVWIENHHDIEAKRQRDEFDRQHPENTFAIGEEAVQAQLRRLKEQYPNLETPMLEPAKKVDSKKELIVDRNGKNGGSRA